MVHRTVSRITIEDVAKAAGVSRQTVSRAINNLGEISPATRARILQVAKELGYLPSGVARSLATRSSHTIGLVVPDIANPFFSEIARGVEEAAYLAEYRVFLSNTAEDALREWVVIEALEKQRVAGIIICSSRLPAEQVIALRRSQTPLVFLNREVEGDQFSCLLVDDYNGARQAVEYLLRRGHRAIGLLSGPSRSWSGQRRLTAYRETMERSGFRPAELWIVAGFPQIEGGKIAAQQLFSQAPEITAILAYNDLMAVGATQACEQSGRRVPDDCAIIGFDDIPLAALVKPALTTVHLEKQEAGRRAFNLLRQLIENEKPGAITETLNTHLVVRESA